MTAVEVYIAAATKSVVALDFSFSLGKNLNGKGGATILLDFENERTEMYTHRGVYLGNSIGLGLNYTASFVGNYNKKGGYAGPFIFAGATYNGYGVDYCFGSKKSDAYGIGVTIGTGEEIGWYGGYDEYKYCGGFDW